MPALLTSRMRRLRAQGRRGSALLLGVALVGALAVLALAGWHISRDSLLQTEVDRERGRVWGMACASVHRAIQSGLITSPNAIPPGPILAPAVLTMAQLKHPPAPFSPFLPAGLAGVEKVGANSLTVAYGAVMDLQMDVPVAVCSLSGPDLEVRYGSLREGAVMGGLDLVGVKGGEETAMHPRLPALEGQLGALADGAMYATGDFGVGHAAERLHRVPVGGRPDLARMEQSLSFGGTARDLLNVVEVEAAEGRTDGGQASGTRTEVGGVATTFTLNLTGGSGTPVRSDKGFAFGGVQTVFDIPAELAVGTSMKSRGVLAARTMTVTGELDGQGGIDASLTLSAGSLDIESDDVPPVPKEISGNTARVTGLLTVANPPGCLGCNLPGL